MNVSEAVGARGRTTVSDRAVSRIAERAAAEALPPGEAVAVSAAATTRGGRAAVSVELTLPYRAAVGDAGDRVQRYVAERTAALTGLAVADPRVVVRGLTPRAGSRPDTAAPDAGGLDGRARRLWSERRPPASAAALLGLAACAATLYDIVCVHVLGRPPASWRSRLLTWLTTHGPGDVTLALGTAIAVLGVGSVLLALTPGRRRLLPMSTTERGVRAALDRTAAKRLLRDAVSDVSGVSPVRVRVGRRRARIRAVVEFGDRDTAHRRVVTVAHEALTACGLGRTPRLRVRLRTAPRAGREVL
ncbi:DUF6286 domain-containing protein [Streptomyces sp. S.PB5]|uniref:DUF6286 domain-containing protein n=1 Tax=Streptomyces sp. S.PB5 TaxID=3020844 RepID=UPI0025AF1F51|nr:DUF6286 domain-containing protein [Streptomyces sp. S.PB5]MDN3026019.1 DUF6286 domain-containing protein [Streptomyces sp. S.PB5]